MIVVSFRRPIISQKRPPTRNSAAGSFTPACGGPRRPLAVVVALLGGFSGVLVPGLSPREMDLFGEISNGGPSEETIYNTMFFNLD